MQKILDLTGQRFGRLLVLSFSNIGRINCGSAVSMWNCVCDCGTHKIVQGSCMKSGSILSCGCGRGVLKGPQRADLHPLYTCWKNMRRRCTYANHPSFPQYGGRGITVCDRWKDNFWAFAEDMGDRPDGYSIERVDVNGNYEPSNCIWADDKAQRRNRTNNHPITWRGKTMVLADWAPILGLTVGCLATRIGTYGWTVERAFTTPGQYRSPNGTRGKHIRAASASLE